MIRTLNDHNITTDAPVEMVFWTNEEGSRFVPVMMGLGVFAGHATLEDTYSTTDVNGKSVGEELQKIGYVGDQVPGDHPMGAYFEAHIEQGPILEDENVTIGEVTGVLGIRWYDCVVGQDSHAGPTPMHLRKDALQVSTQIMQKVVAIARKTPEGRGTVRMVQVIPNSRNVVPGEVRFSIDLRNLTDDAVDDMDAELKAYLNQIREDTGLPITLTQVSHYPAVPFHAECRALVRDAAETLGYSHRRWSRGSAIMPSTWQGSRRPG